MNHTKELINAIESGDAVAVQHSFEQAMLSRIADRLGELKQSVAQNMFKTQQESVEEENDLEEEIEPHSLAPAHPGFKGKGKGNPFDKPHHPDLGTNVHSGIKGKKPNDNSGTPPHDLGKPHNIISKPNDLGKPHNIISKPKKGFSNKLDG